MNVPPRDLSESDVLDACRRWDPGIDAIEYLPLGFGSHHWRARTAAGWRYFLTVDDLATKTWLGGDCDSAFEVLGQGFQAAWALRDDGGLDFVLGPIPSPEGAFAVRLSEQYSLAVLPLVDGFSAGGWSKPADPAYELEALRRVAAVHGAPSAFGAGVRTDVYDIAGRASLEAALAQLDEPWDGGPLGEPARNELIGGRGLLERSLIRFDGLAADVREGAAGRLRLTHGEPHPGNFIVDNVRRLHLIDWDTLAVAPPERDLWMFTSDSLRLYTEITGRDVEVDALSFYRLNWVLNDMVAFAGFLGGPHEQNADTEKTLRALHLSLEQLDRGGGADVAWLARDSGGLMP